MSKLTLMTNEAALPFYHL